MNVSKPISASWSTRRSRSTADELSKTPAMECWQQFQRGRRARCAAEVQRGMADRMNTPEDKRITFRIGINLGDVIAEPDDIYGDGVNVAARLEALAEPGDICVSRAVRDQILRQLPYPFEDKGDQTVKNQNIAIRAGYTSRPEAVAELPAAGVSVGARQRRRANPLAVAAAVATMLVIAVIAWWVWPVSSVLAPTSTNPVGLATERSQAAPSTLEPAVAPRHRLSCCHSRIQQQSRTAVLRRWYH